MTSWCGDDQLGMLDKCGTSSGGDLSWRARGLRWTWCLAGWMHLQILILDARQNRCVHVFHAFASISCDAKVFLAVPQDNVVTSFQVFGRYDENVNIYKGVFQKTLADFHANSGPAGERLAILRVDGNHHDSYQDGFVPVGGFVIFDDVQDHPRAMLAWREFLEDGLPEELIQIDHHSAYFKKTREITINFAKMHPLIDVNRGGR